MYNHNKAQQSKNRVHISWDILYVDVLFANYWDKFVQNTFVSVIIYACVIILYISSNIPTLLFN